MITYYKTLNNRVKKIKQYEENCWINCITPDEDEIESLIDDFNIDPEFLKAALDAEESSHIDSEDGNTLIIIDVPIVQKTEKNISYQTMPLGIMITSKNVITISLRENFRRRCKKYKHRVECTVRFEYNIANGV